MSSFGSEKIQAILKGDSTLTTLLDTFTIGSNTYPAIFFDEVIPDTFSGTDVVNFYRNTPVDNTLDYTDTIYTINCRSNKRSTAESIQAAVKDALNRKNPLSGRGIFICSALPIIPPADERDQYNAPIEARIKIT